MSLYTKPQKIHYQFIIGKLLTFFTLFLFATIPVHICAEHKSFHQINLGNPEARLAVTQNFSLGSPEFLRFAKEEFSAFKTNFINTALVSWIFCPYVVDLASIQRLSCLETIPFLQKLPFFNRVLLELNPKTFGKIFRSLIRSLEGLLISKRKLELPQFLRLGEFFNQVGEFLDKKVSAALLTYIEIGNRVFDFLLHPAAIRY